MRGEAGVRFELIQQTVSNPDNTRCPLLSFVTYST